MTWKSHALINAAVTYTVTHDPKLALVAGSTASLPDWTECFFPLSQHRTWTHLLLGWILLAGYAHLHAWSPLAQTIIFSGLLHVIMDAFSVMGVPIILPGWGNIHIGLYHTGKWSEYLVAILFLTSIGLVWYSGCNVYDLTLPSHKAEFHSTVRHVVTATKSLT